MKSHKAHSIAALAQRQWMTVVPVQEQLKNVEKSKWLIRKGKTADYLIIWH